MYHWSLLILILIRSSESITVYSSVQSNGTSSMGSGLKLLPDSVSQPSNFTQGITICGRFNLARLAGSNFILAIGQQMWLFMGYAETFLEFGFRNWVIKDLATDNFYIWSTNRWHQICLSFDRQSHHLMFVKDGTVTNLNFVQTDLELQYLNEVVTTEFYAGRSWWDPGVIPTKKVASVNIWDRALTLKEAEDWTSCRYVEYNSKSKVDR